MTPESVSLIVPWSHSSERWRLWSFLRPAWEDLGFEVVLAERSAFGPWIKGAAWAEGVQKASRDVVCLMDADCWVPALPEALRLLEQDRWVQGQNMVVRLTKEATERILIGVESVEEAARSEDNWAEQARVASAGVGTILRRDDAEAIPLDRRFVGWGWEDNAWYEALTTLLGSGARLSNSLCYHLWHTPQPDKDRRPTSESPNWLLYRQYVRARGRPSKMREVVAEALRAGQPPGSDDQ